MAFADLITNPVAILKAAGYVEGDTRRTIDDQSDMGSDTCFQVEVTTATEVLAQHGISNNIRNATLSVRVRFFVGGGDAGGQAHGGDLRHVDARAFDQTCAMVALLESQLRYDANTTGIRRRNWRSSEVAATDRRSVTWEILMDVEWEQVEDPRAVAA